MTSATKRSIGPCVIAIVACIVLVACASAPAVTSDVDPSVDFSQFRTYRVLDSDVAAISAEFPSRVEG